MRKPIEKFSAFNYLFKIIALFSALLYITACGPRTVERPRDPWVFRSVLDERPRMITLALHQDLWSAYDTQQCGLYKVWNGGVDFDGAVYTTKHGPQPTSYGADYLTDPLTVPIWSINSLGNMITVTPEYQGHQFENGQVRLQYHLPFEDQTIIVEETPEYIYSNNKPGLSRTFEVEGLELGQQLALNVVMDNLPTEFSFTTNGSFREISRNMTSHGGEEIYQITGTLLMDNGATKFEVLFIPTPQGETKVEETKVTDALTLGANLIENSDCKTCHNETQRTVGPSYLEIAQRYPNNAGSVKELSAKIMAGGSGNWGEVPMTAHPDLTEIDAGHMVKYILSLDNESEVNSEEALLLGEPTIPIDLSGDYEITEDQNLPGLATSLYLVDDMKAVVEILDGAEPILSGVSPTIHITDKADLGKINNDVLVDFHGYLTVEEATNADFRLVSDDGSFLYINDQLIIDNGGFHSIEGMDGEVTLNPGKNSIRVVYFNGAAEGLVSLQWAPHGAESYSIVPAELLSHHGYQVKRPVPHVPKSMLVRNIPGDQNKLQGVHPSFDLAQARPDSFTGRIGGMDFLSDGSLLVSTWDSLGPVYRLRGVDGNDPESIEVTRIATGLAEPLGLKVVDDEIYVLQKQELTQLIDHDGDGIIDEYRTVCDDWQVSANFHEFAFGLEYKDGFFYATLATAINPGGASTQPQIPDRGKAIRISRETGELEFVATGLRTPNGIGTGVDDQLFIADNQGDWLPASKIVHLQEGAWFGSRSVDFAGTEGLTETLPVVWLPQNEIGNSPSMPVVMKAGPYQGQMIHGEVTHGGIKRVYIEKVNGQYQGAVFRFSQGFEAGVNRLRWGPDGSLYVGCVGSSGNWGDGSGQWYGLQRLTYNNKPTFEMLAIRAKTDGVELEFTEPIEAGSGQRAEEYQVQQWYYLPTENYGGPKMDLKDLQIKSVNLSEDRKKVFLELPGIKAGHVVYVRIYQPFRSASHQSLWTTEGWYTMNQLPESDPGFRNPTGIPQHNTLTEAEKAAGWELLFDGKTTSGWRKFQGETIGSAWKVMDGTLTLDNRRKQENKIIGGGDIVTEQVYEDYELVLDWKIESGGNSGVMYNVLEDEQYQQPWHTGPEMQILDNLRHRDGRIETHRSGDLYDLIACKFVTANGPGEWNSVRIISEKGKMSFWLNGYEVVNFEMHTPEWEQMVAQSKFKNQPDFGKSKSGHIALQDHGDQVWFRNIKIRKL